MYIIRVFDPKYWTFSFKCSPYDEYPKKHQSLKAWAEESKSTLTTNLCYFNMATATNVTNKVEYITVQYLHIDGKDVAYGGTEDKLSLPTGDNKVSGFTLGIKDGIVYEKGASTKRSRNALGITSDGRYISVQTTKGYTLKSVATYTNSYIKNNYNTTVKLLLMMDGGGSTGCYSRSSKILFAPEKEGTNGRLVPSVINYNLKSDYKFDKTLSRGSRGEDVRMLQIILGNVEVDGIFGAGTRASVIQAQKNLGITPDGIVGPITFKALGLKK